MRLLNPCLWAGTPSRLWDVEKNVCQQKLWISIRRSMNHSFLGAVMKDGLEVFYKVPVLAFQSWLWTFFAQMFCITLCVFQKTTLFFFCRYFGGINVRYHYKWVKRLLKCHFWSFLPFIKAAILLCYPNINMSPLQGSPGMVSSLIMEVKSYWLLLFAVKHFLSVMEKAAGILPAEVNNTEHCGAVDTVVCFCRSFINIYVREAEWKQTEVKAISSTVLLLPPNYLSGFTRKHTHTHTYPSLGTDEFGGFFIWEKCVKPPFWLYRPNYDSASVTATMCNQRTRSAGSGCMPMTSGDGLQEGAGILPSQFHSIFSCIYHRSQKQSAKLWLPWVTVSDCCFSLPQLSINNEWNGLMFLCASCDQFKVKLK